jgi:hypothetical protein
MAGLGTRECSVDVVPFGGAWVTVGSDLQRRSPTFIKMQLPVYPAVGGPCRSRTQGTTPVDMARTAVWPPPPTSIPILPISGYALLFSVTTVRTRENWDINKGPTADETGEDGFFYKDAAAPLLCRPLLPRPSSCSHVYHSHTHFLFTGPNLSLSWSILSDLRLTRYVPSCLVILRTTARPTMSLPKDFLWGFATAS